MALLLKMSKLCGNLPPNTACLSAMSTSPGGASSFPVR
jgi:hypothetical protein